MPPRPRGGIFSRILAGYIALAVAVVFLAGGICYVLVRQYNVSSSLNDLSQKAEIVADMAGQPGGRMRFLSSSRLYETQRLTDARFIYVDSDMVASFLNSDPDADGAPPILTESDYDVVQTQIIDAVDQKLIERIFAGETVSEARRLALLDMRIVLSGAPIRDIASDDPEAVVGAIILLRPLGDVSAVARRIALLFSVAGFAAICVALVVSWALSRRIARPVTLLSQAARRISEGDYRPIAPVRGAGEIEELGQTLNSLSGRLTSVIASLSNEKSKLEQILAGIGEGIVAIDTSGRIIHHNAAALELMQASSWRLDEQLARHGNLRPLLERATRERARFETEWERADRRKIRASVYPVYDDAGETAIGSVALLRDVSEAARLEQMRRDYIANVSHELRTPLTGIRGMAEPLLDGLIDTEEERRSCYKVIYQETIRLEKLIGDMLDMSRLQEGRVRLELDALDARVVLEAARDRMRKRAEDAGVALSLETPDAPLVCLGDEDRLLQVLIIFLDNAFGFTPSGGSVAIFGRAEGGRVVIGVRDTGSGIDPKDLPYIWERFFKADRSRMRTTGTGLGLAIAKMVAELMNGEIGARSELGRGSEFYVKLAAPEGL